MFQCLFLSLELLMLIVNRNNSASNYLLYLLKKNFRAGSRTRYYVLVARRSVWRIRFDWVSFHTLDRIILQSFQATYRIGKCRLRSELNFLLLLLLPSKQQNPFRYTDPATATVMDPPEITIPLSIRIYNIWLYFIQLCSTKNAFLDEQSTTLASTTTICNSKCHWRLPAVTRSDVPRATLTVPSCTQPPTTGAGVDDIADEATTTKTTSDMLHFSIDF